MINNLLVPYLCTMLHIDAKDRLLTGDGQTTPKCLAGWTKREMRYGRPVKKLNALDRGECRSTGAVQLGTSLIIDVIVVIDRIRPIIAYFGAESGD